MFTILNFRNSPQTPTTNRWTARDARARVPSQTYDTATPSSWESFPPLRQWPTFEAASLLAHNTSDSSSFVNNRPVPSTRHQSARDVKSADYIPTRRTKPTSSSKRSRPPNYIPRPRNAFMIFRSEFLAQKKISGKVEHDHRHISRIVGHCWNQLPQFEKQVWQEKALQEKADHAIKYPGYRFTPSARPRKAAKRNVKRNGAAELDRCRQVADLLLEGKQGQELEAAVEVIDISIPAASSSLDRTADLQGSAIAPSTLPNSRNVQAFRSPILPPATVPQAIPNIQIPEPQCHPTSYANPGAGYYPQTMDYMPQSTELYPQSDINVPLQGYPSPPPYSVSQQNNPIEQGVLLFLQDYLQTNPWFGYGSSLPTSISPNGNDYYIDYMLQPIPDSLFTDVRDERYNTLPRAFNQPPGPPPVQYEQLFSTNGIFLPFASGQLGSSAWRL